MTSFDIVIIIISLLIFTLCIEILAPVFSIDFIFQYCALYVLISLIKFIILSINNKNKQ